MYKYTCEACKCKFETDEAFDKDYPKLCNECLDKKIHKEISQEVLRDW